MNLLKNKPLQNQALIYDKDCPMCCVYTSAFIKAGVLEQNGRQPYSEQAIDSTEWDAERAKNEIALVNYEKGTVIYGIDSMFAVISHRFTFLKPLFSWKSFHWLMKKFYSFISYNRKVIAPPAKNPADITCVPDVNLKYRTLYLVFAWVVTGVLVAQFTTFLEPNVPASSSWREILICGGQMVFQTGVIMLLGQRNKLMDYLGNLMTVSLEGALLLSPALVLAQFIEIPFGIVMIYFTAVVGFMFLIHYKRAKSLGLGIAICLTWVLYRVLLLPFIL